MAKKRDAIELFGELLLVRQAPVEPESPGGIVMPTSTKPKLYKSTVVRVGRGRRSDNHDGSFIDPLFKEGDEVVHLHSGREFGLPVDGEHLHLINESDVLARV